MRRLTIVTNACANDDTRLGPVLRSWLRVFGPRLDTLLIVVNPVTPTGRIADLHGNAGTLQNTLDVVRKIQREDERVWHVVLPDSRTAAAELDGWFVGGVPFLCQAGTPILPFVYGMASVTTGLVLRSDCDMIFYDQGFVDHAGTAIDGDTLDIVEPYRGHQAHVQHVSTRAFLFDPERFRRNCLPLRHAHLDWPRAIHRMLTGRPRVLALEQSLTNEKLRGRIRHGVLSEVDGWSLHFGRRSDFAVPGVEDIIRRVEKGVLTDAQRRSGANFDPAAWVVPDA